MKKRGRKSRTGNPAADVRKPPGAPLRDNWLARETSGFFNLPEWAMWVVILLVIGVPVAIWRWLVG